MNTSLQYYGVFMSLYCFYSACPEKRWVSRNPTIAAKLRYDDVANSGDNDNATMCASMLLICGCAKPNTITIMALIMLPAFYSP